MWSQGEAGTVGPALQPHQLSSAATADVLALFSPSPPTTELLFTIRLNSTEKLPALLTSTCTPPPLPPAWLAEMVEAFTVTESVALIRPLQMPPPSAPA